MTAQKALLLALALAGTPSLPGAANYSVNGVVIDSQSQRPLANARVSLAPAIARVQKLELVTKQDGLFSFVVNQAGKYSLEIAKPGYPVQSCQQGGIAGVSSAIVVRDDQDTSHVVFQARRGGVVAGQIKDEDSEPVGNAVVTIFRSMVVGGERKIFMWGQTQANAAGEFRFPNLLRGGYYICAVGRPWFADSLIYLGERQRRAGPQPDEPPQYSPDPDVRGTAFVPTFYPRAQTIEEAGLIRLETGSEVQASITLPLAKAVTVKGTVSASGISGGSANLLKKVSDQYVSFLQGTVAQDGTFQFANVPAGSYEIIATSNSGSGASSWNVGQEIEAGTSDMEVTLRPRPMGALMGRVLFEGERTASTASLFVTLRNEKGNLVRTQVDPEGNFSLSRILPGRYEVAAASTDYVAAYFAGPSGEHLPLTLEVASGEPVHRDLMLTRAIAGMEGTVEKAGMPQVGAFVLLMPKNPSARWAYRFDQTDSDGSYRLANIPAGDYVLIALSDGSDVVYRDAKVAAGLGGGGKQGHVESGAHPNTKKG